MLYRTYGRIIARRKRHTAYNYIDASYDDSSVTNFDVIACKVEFYNRGGRCLHFHSSYRQESDAGSGEKTCLRFIWIHGEESSKKEAEMTLTEMADLLETDILCTAIEPADMTLAELQRLNTAKQLMVNNMFQGRSRTRWNVRPAAEIMSRIKALRGLNDFKDAVAKLKVYCDNVNAAGLPGNYNIVLINKSGINTERFLHMIYDLYDAEGVIRDHCIIEGSLEEAAVTEKNTAFLYHVRYEDLVYGTSELQLSMNSKNLSTIAKRETIYIFDMTSEQYEKFQTLDLFQAVFLHKIEIGALEPSEKLAWLRDEAANYGLAISKDLIKQEELLKMPLDYLTGLLVSAMGRLITENLPRKELTAADFMPEKNKQKKEADPYKELESLVGLGAVKDQIREIVCFVKNRGREILPCLHMVFCGNPGTGKTTVARLIGRIFAKEGIIKKKNVFVEASREDLVGLYVGHTAQKTAEKITDAMGGLLFIDEAYSLGLYDKGHDFGDEALSTLVKQMEDRRKDFVCIMAGYTEEMNKMLDVNPGLRDRIQFFIDFPDYNGEELLEIFSGFCKERKYKLLRKAKEALGNYLEEIVKRKGKNFANARLVRKICERIMMKQALRTTDNRITAADIEAIFAEKDMKALVEGNGQKKKIGFSGQ